MSEQPLKVRQFQSLDEFRQWWWSEEVTQFCNDHPDQVDALKNHRFVKSYLDELERETSAGAEQQAVAPQPTGKTFGKYTLEKKLGQGGMGAVYLAFDPALNRRVALKVMALKGTDAIERFQREARASAKLKHPNIIQVYEVGTQSKYHYFTMEYVEGASLDSQIKTKKLSNKRIAEVIRDIASALDYAHKQQIIHRDIKPANILMDKAGRPYLTDFGLAKETTGLEKSLTLSGTVVGTPDYMSPEQARGEKRLDHRSDIFSLGATLYHSLTGQVPFIGKELYQVMEQVVHKEPIQPSRLVRALPSDLETICLKCMEKEPAKRYPNAGDLADDLTRFLKGDVIRARPISTAEKLWRKVRQNKIASFGVAAGIGLLAVGLIISHLVSSSATAGKLDEYRKEADKYYKAGKFEDAKAACDKILEISYDMDIDELRDECEAGIKKKEKEGKEKDTQAEAIRKQAELRDRAKAVLDRIKSVSTPDDKIKTAQEALARIRHIKLGKVWTKLLEVLII
jgi:serine/threonine-protein kinase